MPDVATNRATATTRLSLRRTMRLISKRIAKHFVVAVKNVKTFFINVHLILLNPLIVVITL
jgi:hypothetical protein